MLCIYVCIVVVVVYMIFWCMIVSNCFFCGKIIGEEVDGVVMEGIDFNFKIFIVWLF